MTNKEEIDKETDKYLGITISSDNSGIFKEPDSQVSGFSMKISLIDCPDYSKWIQTAYEIGITTWEQSGIKIKSDSLMERRKLAERLMCDRPISAIFESAIFVIKITNVSRTITHQLVRHRNMAFNQQSFRVSSCYPDSVRLPEGILEQDRKQFEHTVKECRGVYKKLIKSGIPMEQARNIMPMGTQTKIVMVASLSELKKYLKARSSVLTQDEHHKMVELVKVELQSKCPEFYRWLQ